MITSLSGCRRTKSTVSATWSHFGSRSTSTAWSPASALVRRSRHRRVALACRVNAAAGRRRFGSDTSITAVRQQFGGESSSSADRLVQEESQFQELSYHPGTAR